MFRRKTKDERRKIGFCVILFAGTILAMLVACSDNTEAAGVISETESGKTIAGVVVDANGSPMANAHVALLKSVNTYYGFSSPTILRQTRSDSLGQFLFENIPASSFSLMTSNQDLSQSQLDSSNLLLGYARIPYTFTDTLIDTLNYQIKTMGTATLLISTAFKCYEANRHIYISGTFANPLITEEDVKRGFIEIKGIPADTTFNDVSVALYDQSVTCYQFISLGKATIAPGKTLYMGAILSKDELPYAATLADVIGNITLELPSSVRDSFPGYEIDSLILPVKFSKEGNYSISTRDGNTQDAKQSYTCGDSVCYWAAIPFTEPTQPILLLANYEQMYHQPAPLATYRVKHFSAEVEPGTSLNKQVFSEDTSFAISFWIHSESAESDSSQSILSAMNNGMGFEIGTCEKDRQFACTSIHTGLDSANGNTVISVKAQILDGKKHHYSMVLHKKHLTVAVDGIAIRDTDLKLSPQFYELGGITTGSYALGNFMHYSFGDFIRKSGDKDWNRLKAWLKAFYEMQKQ